MGDFFVKDNLAGLRREDFQATVQGKKVDLFILKNKKGSEIAVTNFAGALCAIMMPDRNGKMESVVWGHDSLQHVMESQETYLSVLIGRYGNRIAAGKFTLDGKQYSLAINNDPNSLHGGPTGFHKRVFDAEQTDAQTLHLHYLCKDGEEGFPGNLDVNVTYRLTDDNELVIEYEATTDRKTVVCLTNHAYFNLDCGGSVLRHTLRLNASEYLPTDSTLIPLGPSEPVAGTPMDFLNPKRLGKDIRKDFPALKTGKGYDACWLIDGYMPGQLQEAALLKGARSGRTLKVFTTQPGVQVYTGNWLEGCPKGKRGKVYHDYYGVAIECQHFPDSPNKPDYPPVVLKPGKVFHEAIVFAFGVE